MKFMDDMFPTLIIKENVKFPLQVSRNKDIFICEINHILYNMHINIFLYTYINNFFLRKTHRLLNSVDVKDLG